MRPCARKSRERGEEGNGRKWSRQDKLKEREREKEAERETNRGEKAKEGNR